MKENNKIIQVEALEEFDMKLTNVSRGIRFEHIQTLCHAKMEKEETEEILLVQQRITNKDTRKMMIIRINCSISLLSAVIPTLSF